MLQAVVLHQFWVHQRLPPKPTSILSIDPNWRSTWLIVDGKIDLYGKGVNTYLRQLLYSVPYSQYSSVNYHWVSQLKGQEQPTHFGMIKLFLLQFTS